MLKNPQTECDIDSFTGTKVSALKVTLAHKFRLGGRVAKLDPIPLETYDSPHMPGLRVAQKDGTAKKTGTGEYKDIKPLGETLSASGKDMPIVIATIRMGFGHHRIAYAACSWALETGRTTIFHDLLNIESEEADLIKSTDELYSRFSRYASEMGGPVEKLWGNMMLSGDADALRIAALTAAHLQPLLLAYPKDIPIITTHQLCALVCSAVGFTNVVNLVVDNHAQWFLTVPNTLNLVQGPVNWMSFLRFGIDPAQLACAGHWCPADMVRNIKQDCQRRIQRRKSKKPLRMLIPVGGAGAQRKFIVALVKGLGPMVKEGSVQLLLNAGDHVHMKTAFLQALDEAGLPFGQITTMQGVYDLQKKLLGDKEPDNSVTLCCFSKKDYFAAVATTDVLSRVADVLTCKPSELAFACLPKLHIRRVGDHEADSARRAAELGDGTLEAREVEDALDYVKLFMNSTLLSEMCEAIQKQQTLEVYDGCRVAVAKVLQKGGALGKSA
eukprot:scaffold3953_cov169-Amphora_coffeaeformis.AAC.32